jgi:hypothetical protein
MESCRGELVGGPGDERVERGPRVERRGLGSGDGFMVDRDRRLVRDGRRHRDQARSQGELRRALIGSVGIELDAHLMTELLDFFDQGVQKVRLEP